LGSQEFRLEAGDFDGNGSWDLFAVGGTPAVVLPLWNPARGDPGGVLTPPAGKGPSWVSQLLALDTTSDGLLDLVLANKHAPQGGKLWRIRGRGDGTFEEKAPLPGPVGIVLSVARGDLNRDGLVDLAASYFAPESLSLLLGRPDGSFDLSRIEMASGSYHALDVLDLDQDGYEDIAAADVSSNHFLIAWNDGKGGLGDSLRVPGPQGPSAIAGGDLDGDSQMDLVVVAGAFANVVYGRGGRSFEAPRVLDIGYVGADLALGDLDSDGKLDVLAAPLDGDGHLDLLTATPSDLFLLWNQGDRQFVAGPSVLLPSVVWDVTAGDFDGDTRPDAAVATPSLGSEPESEILFFRNLTRRPASSDQNQDGIPDECDPGAFHRGDTTGEGKLDLSDAMATLRFLVQGGTSPPCLDAADSNDDERLDLSDAVFLLDYLFRGGDPPSLPGPPGAGKACGVDVRGPVEWLSCDRYEGC
jgi:hypothetical protein